MLYTVIVYKQASEPIREAFRFFAESFEISGEMENLINKSKGNRVNGFYVPEDGETLVVAELKEAEPPEYFKYRRCAGAIKYENGEYTGLRVPDEEEKKWCDGYFGI